MRWLLRIGALSQFQRDDGDGGEDDADQPEADDDLRLWHHVEGLLDDGVDACIAGLLEVVMQGGHLEDALPRAGLLFGVLEVEDLQHD